MANRETKQRYQEQKASKQDSSISEHTKISTLCRKIKRNREHENVKTPPSTNYIILDVETLIEI